jgi:hypothetical protein
MHAGSGISHKFDAGWFLENLVLLGPRYQTVPEAAQEGYSEFASYSFPFLTGHSFPSYLQYKMLIDIFLGNVGVEIRGLNKP